MTFLGLGFFYLLNSKKIFHMAPCENKEVVHEEEAERYAFSCYHPVEQCCEHKNCSGPCIDGLNHRKMFLIIIYHLNLQRKDLLQIIPWTQALFYVVSALGS
jgi:hypothetical protein